MKLLKDHLHELLGRKVLVRCNFDVPLANNQVQDTTRIDDCSETLRILLENGCKLILLAHQDRPGGKADPEASLKPVVDVLELMLGETVAFADDLNPELIEQMPARIILVENLRFWPGEEANDEEFADQLTQLGDFYVNEAFAVCHRQHASVIELPKKLPGYAGFHLEREIRVLSKVRNQPEHPLLVVIGGAKVQTKEPLARAFMKKADKILVGGKIVSSLVIPSQSRTDKGSRSGNKSVSSKLILAQLKVVEKDITEESARQFAREIMDAKTVIWNGPMGVFEEPEFETGTRIVAEAIDQTRAFTVVGGGDTEAALTKFDLEHNIDHISSGGGAMMEFLIKGTLPGIEVLGYKS